MNVYKCRRKVDGKFLNKHGEGFGSEVSAASLSSQKFIENKIKKYARWQNLNLADFEIITYDLIQVNVNDISST